MTRSTDRGANRASTPPRVLVSDTLAPAALETFRQRGIDVDFLPDLGADPARLAAQIAPYDGLAVRSATRVSHAILEAATNLKVIGRAGIGIDNIDTQEASRRGVIVMNTPFGNAITTAEHSIALMFAIARQIPAANASTHAGKWEKSRFLGRELANKTLGVIGVGNIGQIVCDRARGLHIHVIAYDPYLSEERAAQLGVEKLALDDLLVRADVITLHVPLTEQTHNILSRQALARTKRGVCIINCARGGLVDEQALADLLQSGHISGAGLDVFAVEPAHESPLFHLPNVVCTPHLGAATLEAQENVAIQIAKQMSAYLLTGAVENALNMPSVSAAEARVMAPWIALAGYLGAFVGQMTHEPIRRVNLLCDGSAARMNAEALRCAFLAGLLRHAGQDVNLVSAPLIARERGIHLSMTHQDKSGVFDGYVQAVVQTQSRERAIAGTVFSDGKPRFIQIKGIGLDAEIYHHMLYTTNRDVPGIIGVLGQTLGAHGVNIANFTLGRAAAGGEAIALLALDEAAPAEVCARLVESGLFSQVTPLVFDVGG